LGDVGQLASRRGAQIKHAFSRPWIQFVHRQQRARVLHVKQAMLKTGQARQWRVGFQFEDKIFLQPIAPEKVVFDTFVPPLFEQAAGIGAERVQAGEGFRGGVVPCKEEAQSVRSPAPLPSLAEPVRMGKAKRGLTPLEVLENFSRFTAFARVAAQQGVDETRLRPAAELAGQLDALVHRRVIGNALEPEHLVKTKPQEDLKCGRLGAAPGLARDEPVEGSLPTDDAINQFLAQSPVRRGQGWQARFQEIFDVIRSPLTLLEQACGNFSWFLNSNRLIMTIV